MLGFVHAISFQDFQPMWSPPMLQTDGQTDDMRSQDRALPYILDPEICRVDEKIYWCWLKTGMQRLDPITMARRRPWES